MVGLILGTGGNGADLTQVTAAASDVAKGKVIVGPDGQPITGTLDTYGVTEITPKSTAQTINGPIIIPDSLTVKAVQTQSKTVYPSRQDQTITPDSGKYLADVTVKGIKGDNGPAEPNDVTTFTINIGVAINKLLAISLQYEDNQHSSPSVSRVIATRLFDSRGIEQGDILETVYVKASSTASWESSDRTSAKYVSVYSIDYTTGKIVLKGETTYHRFYDWYYYEVLFV